jgi:hypothetical protein
METMAKRTSKKTPIDPDLGDPSLMLVRMRPELATTSGQTRSRTITAPGGRTIDLEGGVFYIVADESIRARVLEQLVDFGRPFELSRNPKLFEELAQTVAIEEELAAKPRGLRPDQHVGAAANPRRIELAALASVLASEALITARATLEALETATAAARSHVAFLENAG